MDLRGWLRALGLERYEAAFRENAIDYSVLLNLTAEDLKDLGVSLVGHRRKLLDAISKLRTAPSDVLSTTDESLSDGAERRQVTVMFSDLVGSTALSARMDPEDLRELISSYQNCVAETVRRFGGFVAKFMGDGVLVYFGYPQAHEDDAERAVRAGLELIGAVAGLKMRVPLQTRVGIATGLVVVGDLIGSGEAQERGIVGETPNLAARLQGTAEPNTVVVAESTRRLLGILFELHDLGQRDLKGITGPSRAWAVLRPSSVASRFEALHATGLTALVGREEELDLLLRRWSKAKACEGQVVLVSGEAGIGKSRLTAALLERLAAEPHRRMRSFCSPQRMDSSLYPIVGQIERAAGLAHNDTQQARLDKLDALLKRTATSIEDTALFAEMLSLSNDGRYPALDLTPQQRRQRTLQALISQIETMSRQSPVLIIFEDAHWSDPTSLELFGLVVDRIQNLRGLLIVTFRPEFNPPWVGRPHVTALTINRLTKRDVDVMIDRVVGKHLLSTTIRQDIIERSDGIPLFTEEITKAVMEAESEDAAERRLAAVPSPALAVPASLHASLIARLDRLGVAREVAQIGATIGRVFSYTLLASVARKTEAELGFALDRLIEAGLLFRQGVPPYASYLFKHALVQDAAYGTLLREPRRALHVRIAQAIENQFAEIAKTSPELVAHHYSEAGRPAPAVTYWYRAGENAVRGSANQEAIGHLTAGLAQLALLPDTIERAKQELTVYRLLGQASSAMRGYASPETKAAFSRAHELCVTVGDDVNVCPVLFGVWLFELAGGYHAEAMKTATEVLAQAQRKPSKGARTAASICLACSHLHAGTVAHARPYFLDGLDCYRGIDEVKAASIAYEYGMEVGAPGYAYSSWCFWLLGYPDEALRMADEALEIAKRIKHSVSYSRGPYLASGLHAFRREWPVVEARATAAIAAGQHYGLAMVVAVGRIMRASAQAMLKPNDESLTEIRDALAAYRATGARFQGTYHLVLLAQALAARVGVTRALPPCEMR
ncbi:Adenylate cyclase 1 [Bradyrhizobium ivorense]|uniref:Adenylate cyclase 1 n=1 Tax=Bradyrhizobium ivorense TaxID=2511166 RepID=A0A508ST90_9BRAD|nr:adenylate/guanylate cyclase domain-containing protein [Bradyrhizobium ivorense]VIO65216.1 Adenylate cyclase 1 [Bradyrhizobium ivorense]